MTRWIFEEEFPQDIAGPVTGIGGLPTRSPLVATSVAVVLLTLIAGVWLLRRRMYQGPKAFMQEPQIYYERLLNWTARLKMPLRQQTHSRSPNVPNPQQMASEITRRAPAEQALTPYEREALLAEGLPQGSPFIRRIIEIYVQFRYAPRPGASWGRSPQRTERQLASTSPRSVESMAAAKVQLARLCRAELEEIGNYSATISLRP